MAYMNQEKKKVIAALLKEVMPKHVKYSLSVENHSAIVMNIKSAGINLLEGLKGAEEGHASVNVYWIEDNFAHNPEARDILLAANEALNHDNFYKSDIMSDYHHVGHYVYINIGRWNKPFVVKA